MAVHKHFLKLSMARCCLINFPCGQTKFLLMEQSQRHLCVILFIYPSGSSLDRKRTSYPPPRRNWASSRSGTGQVGREEPQTLFLQL